MSPFTFRQTVVAIFATLGAVLSPAIASADENARQPLAVQAVVQASNPARQDAPQALEQIRRTATMQMNAVASQVPRNVAGTDGSERLLLLAPTEPLIVQMEITIDGQPYRSDREAMIDGLLSDSEAMPLEEVAKSSSFRFGRILYLNDQARAAHLAAFDKNQDGKLDRYECRLLLATTIGAPAFSILPNRFAYPQPEVFDLIDSDNDQRLSAKELAAVEGRLLSRDRNGDDLLDASEITDNGQGTRTVYANRGQAAQQLLLLIGRTLDAAEVHKQLSARYGVASRLPAKRFPSIREELDKDRSGLIELEEVAALNDIPPHLCLLVNLGKTGDKPPGITVVSIRETLGDMRQAVRTIEQGWSLATEGLTLELLSTDTNSPNYNFAANAKALIAQLDTDGNGYLDIKELEQNRQSVSYKQQFSGWDSNQDGKVYPEEIEKAYENQVRPQNYRVSVAASLVGDTLLTTIDETGDGRISLREMRAASTRLAKFDANQDGEISKNELPETMRFGIARGNNSYALLNPQGQRGLASGGFVIGQGRTTSPSDRKVGPEWFQRMDRNGDGDITLREFLGDEVQFKQLDRNGDGFIELSEAENTKTETADK